MMSDAIGVVRTEHDATALRGLAARTHDVAQSPPLLAIAMVTDGSSHLDAARQAGLDCRTERDWVHRCNEDGVDGLLSRQGSSPAPKPTGAQMDKPRDLMLDETDPAIRQVVRCRCIDLRHEVARRFPVTVNKRTVGNWLRQLGTTRLQPCRCHPERMRRRRRFSRELRSLLRQVLVCTTAGTPVEA